MESQMRPAAIPAIGLSALVLTATLTLTPAFAQGQGGYGPGVPGAETVRMSLEERARARALHQTNDTSGGRSSIDKSGKTWEAGGTCDNVQGTIYRGRGGSRRGFKCD
jgi:hypothetical protein